MEEHIGFIGQGWIGKNYADDFENRGYEVVRYALEAPFNKNKEALQTCTIIFIAVPTPTTPEGFDYSIVMSALQEVPDGRIAVIKSTLKPGTTRQLQDSFPQITVVHSPEFLVEESAAYDAANPKRNIIGVPQMNDSYTDAAHRVLAVLPKAPYQAIMSSDEAEMVKYAGNCFLYTKVVFMNLLYDLAQKSGMEWENIRQALVHDPRIGTSHTSPVHKTGRGAGGHCFIKDFEAFIELYEDVLGKDVNGLSILQSLREKNLELLTASKKDIDLMKGVYGESVSQKYKDIA